MSLISVLINPFFRNHPLDLLKLRILFCEFRENRLTESRTFLVSIIQITFGENRETL